MNVVMIVPTGIGCEIGGHCGDGNAPARLLGACCETLVLHPNVVNASDINEMPPNALYVEGNHLDRFLQGKLFLQKVKSNKVLVVVNKAGGAGSEGFLDVKNAKGEPHKIIITLSNLLTTPLATGVPFNWKDLTPVSMMALSGTTRPVPRSVCRSTSVNMSGLSAPPWLATSMRTLIVRVFSSTVGAT